VSSNSSVLKRVQSSVRSTCEIHTSSGKFCTGSRRTILSTGRSNVEILVFAITLLTWPSLLFLRTSVTPLRGHNDLGTLSSTTRTKSLKVSGWIDSFLSLLQLRQVFSYPSAPTAVAEMFDFLRESGSSLRKKLVGRPRPECSRGKWFGESASGSEGSSKDFVIGPPFTIDSTSHIKVVNPLSSRVCFFMGTLRTLLTDAIQRPQARPKWEPGGGLNNHLTFL